LRIDAVELTHALGEIALRRFDHQMIAIGHLAVGMATPAKPFGPFIAPQFRIEIRTRAMLRPCEFASLLR
jgi:hypothetical protein